MNKVDEETTDVITINIIIRGYQHVSISECIDRRFVILDVFQADDLNQGFDFAVFYFAKIIELLYILDFSFERKKTVKIEEVGLRLLNVLEKTSCGISFCDNQRAFSLLSFYKVGFI